jgi:hypothetical protein
MDKTMYDTSLTDPITPDHLKDISDIEKKRREILKEAKYIKKRNEKLDRQECPQGARHVQTCMGDGGGIQETYPRIPQQHY